MVAVAAIVNGEAISCDKVGANLRLAYRVQSDWPRVPDPQDPRMAVIPNMNAHPTFGAEPGF
jgi:hypothetical protein